MVFLRSDKYFLLPGLSYALEGQARTWKCLFSVYTGMGQYM